MSQTEHLLPVEVVAESTFYFRGKRVETSGYDGPPLWYDINTNSLVLPANTNVKGDVLFREGEDGLNQKLILFVNGCFFLANVARSRYLARPVA